MIPDKFSILDHISKLTSAKGKNRYICPNCGGNNFTISQAKDVFQCWDGCTFKEVVTILAPIKPGEKAPTSAVKSKRKPRPEKARKRVSEDFPCPICGENDTPCSFTASDVLCAIAMGEPDCPDGYIHMGEFEGKQAYVKIENPDPEPDPPSIDPARSENWEPERRDRRSKVVPFKKPYPEESPNTSGSEVLDCTVERIENPEDSAQQGKKTAADELLDLALKATFFHTSEKVAYADIEFESGSRRTYALRSKAFRLWLAGEYYSLKRKGISSQTLQDVLTTLEAIGLFKGELREVYLRVAELEGKIYLDLGTTDWKAVEISPTGWQIVSDYPVRFWRPDTLLPLPYPKEGGSLEDLKDLLNVDQRGWVLISSFLLFAFCPGKTYPVLALIASRGSGKSTTAEFLKSLIDPGKASLIKLSADTHKLAIAASRRWLIAYDNVSYISPNESDNLCTLSTGFGFSTRTLFSTDEETVFDLARPQILTAIDAIVTRDDLADRTLTVRLQEIPDTKRLKKSDLDKKLSEARPKILGALLTTLSQTLADLPNVKPDKLPRMADYGEFAIAAESALGLDPGEFWEAFESARTESRQIVLELSPVAMAIQKFREGRSEPWQGTAEQLLIQLNSWVDDATRRSKSWPSDPARLGKTLNRLAPDLAEFGIKVTMTRNMSSRLIHLEKAEILPSYRHCCHANRRNPSETNGFSDDSKHDGSMTVKNPPSFTVMDTVMPKSQSGQAFQLLHDSNDSNDGKISTFSNPEDWIGARVLYPTFAGHREGTVIAVDYRKSWFDPLTDGRCSHVWVATIGSILNPESEAEVLVESLQILNS